jgi:4-aminobutyrate aminotransferase-like enzyme/Ser/Thr protein kinase RdoA (MazF antagonist)
MTRSRDRLDVLVPLLREEWGLSGALSPLGGENDNHLVTSSPDGGRFVLKIAPAEAARREVALETAAVRALRSGDLGLDLPDAIPTRSGKPFALLPSPRGPDRLARLMTFVQGTPWVEAGTPSPTRMRRAGWTIASVTQALAGLRPPEARRSHRWDLTRAGDLRRLTPRVADAERRGLLQEAFRLWAGAAAFLGELPRGLIHGDLNDENVLLRGDEVVGLLDFGDALDNPLVCELAIALAYLVLGSDDPLSEGALLIEGYHEVRPLSALECELLFPLMCGRLAASAAIATERRESDPERSSWYVTEGPAWSALERYAAIDPLSAADRLTSRIEVAPYADRGAPVHRLLERRRARFSDALSLSFQTPVKFIRGRGPYLHDERGRPHLDLYNNVAHVGHAHPRVVAAGQAAMARLNTNTRYLYDELYEYADRLCSTLPPGLDHCFFVNSGSEANELALRLARAHTGRRDVIVLENAYHGHTRTLVEISPYKFDGPGGEGRPTWVQVAPMPDGYRGPFRGPGPEAGHAYGEAVGDLIRKMERPPGLFIAESLPSVGGQIIPPDGYFETAFRQVRAAGGVCALDEVQTGFGRVGTHFWGFERQGVTPDIVVLGKPIGNGHPLGAVVTTEAIARSLGDAGMEFFSTFGGNPVSCAVGSAVLDVIQDEGLQEHALAVGARLLDGLSTLMDRHPLVGDVRGTGLFIGVELVLDRETRAPATAAARELVEALKERRVLTGTDGPFESVVKIKGPLVLSEDDADLAVTLFDDALRALEVRGSGLGSPARRSSRRLHESGGSPHHR